MHASIHIYVIYYIPSGARGDLARLQDNSYDHTNLTIQIVNNTILNLKGVAQVT